MWRMLGISDPIVIYSQTIVLYRGFATLQIAVNNSMNLAPDSSVAGVSLTE
jgi:hypothetical protein